LTYLADHEVVRIDVGGVDQTGAERAEALLPLDAAHRAAVGVPEVVDAPVVGDRVAGHVRQRVLERDVLATPPDDRRQLALVVAVLTAGGTHHRRPVAAERARRHQEVVRIFRQARLRLVSRPHTPISGAPALAVGEVKG